MLLKTAAALVTSHRRGVRQQERVLDAVRRAVGSGRFPGREPRAIAAQLWALVHGLASIELCGYLRDEQQAARHWRGTSCQATLAPSAGGALIPGSVRGSGTQRQPNYCRAPV